METRKKKKERKKEKMNKKKIFALVKEKDKSEQKQE